MQKIGDCFKYFASVSMTTRCGPEVGDFVVAASDPDCSSSTYADSAANQGVARVSLPNDTTPVFAIVDKSRDWYASSITSRPLPLFAFDSDNIHLHYHHLSPLEFGPHTLHSASYHPTKEVNRYCSPPTRHSPNLPLPRLRHSAFSTLAPRQR